MNVAQHLSHLEALDRALASKGFPPMTDYWRREVRRFYESGRRQSVWRCGRRAGKSLTFCKLAVLEAAFGEHVIPAGDRGIVMVISANTEQAQDRVRAIREMLRALRIPLGREQSADSITLRDRPVVIRVHTASLRSVVGSTTIMLFCDELARWQPNDGGSNPADEILRSARPSLAGQPNARVFLVSSPLGSGDVHARSFDAGETELQTVHFAPTWIARPGLAEAECRSLAADQREFLREYGAQPQAEFMSGFLPADALDAAIDVDRPNVATGPARQLGRYVVTCDPAFASDGFGIAIAHGEPAHGGTRIVVDYAGEIRARGRTYLAPSSAVAEVVRLRQLWQPGGFAVYGDQGSFVTLREMFAAKGALYIQRAWSPTTLMSAWSTVRSLLTTGRLRLPADRAIVGQLSRIGVKLTQSGAETISAAGGHVGDMAAAVAMAVEVAWEQAPWSFDGARREVARTVGTRALELSGVGSSVGREGLPGLAMPVRRGDAYPGSVEAAIRQSERGDR